MSQHIADHKRERSDEGRATHYTKIDREQGASPHPATEALQRRASEVRADKSRLKEYTRVERGNAV